jgi:phospholipid/cholesterol/gamma-HCH transport system substrate-binding protein
MKNNIIETIVGACVIIVAVVFFTYAYRSNYNTESEAGYYRVSAKFQNADGIIEGSSVKIAGIEVGEVEALSLDVTSYSAIVKMKIDKNIPVPTDSSAAIISSGMFGGKFVSLAPGADDTNLKDNDVIKITQSSMNIESLIGKFMLSNNASKDSK